MLAPNDVSGAREAGKAIGVPHRRLVPAALIAAALVAAFILASCAGAVTFTPGELFSIVLYAAGVVEVCDCDPVHAKIWLLLRLPRLLLATLVGAALAIGGAVMQGLFRNPLADPSLIGVSSGGAVAAVAVIVLGAPAAGFAGVSFLPIAAFSGSFLTMLAAYRLARRAGRADMTSLLLAGIAFNALATAAIGFFTLISSQQALRSFTFWLLGGFGDAGWMHVASAATFIVPALAVMLASARVLNALALGERDAIWLGLAVERWKFVLLAAVALGVGAAVAVAGIIGFVGLVAPHLLRFIAGPDHRLVLPCSALLGALIVLLADLAARVVILPSELPVGIVTALLGVPLFLFLLSRRHGAGV